MAPRRCTSLISVLAAWGEDMEQVKQMLEDNESIQGTTVVWFCIFSNYQPGDVFGPSVAEQLAQDPFGAVHFSSAAAPDVLGLTSGRVIRQASAMLLIHTSTTQIYDRLWW